MTKYGYKQCDKCGNKENFEFRAFGELGNGDLFTDYVCKKCGNVIRIYQMRQKAKPNHTGTHDGGWDDM